MAVSTQNTASPNPHIKALREKHARLSEKIEYAQRQLSSSDASIAQLKKQKLLVKEKLVFEENDVAQA